jgi:3-keto-disaccharide hydrolase
MKFFAVALLLAVVPLSAENSLTRGERKEGFVRLFDGHTIRDWHSVRQKPDGGGWIVHKGVLTWQKGGSLLVSDHPYTDFILRFEYRTQPDASGAIILRATPDEEPHAPGIELPIRSDFEQPAGPHSTGAVNNLFPPSKNMAMPDGKWNRVEITLIQQKLTATWNGEKTLDVAVEQAQPFGHIALRAPMGPPIEFRNLRIRVLKVGPKFAPKNADED